MHPDVALAVLVNGRSELALGGRGWRLLRAQLDLGGQSRPRADEECVRVRGEKRNEEHAEHGHGLFYGRFFYFFSRNLEKKEKSIEGGFPQRTERILLCVSG